MWILQVLDSITTRLALVSPAAARAPESRPAQAYLSGTELKMLCLWERYGNCLEDYMGLSENVGLIFLMKWPFKNGIMISKTIGYNGVHYFQTHPYYFHNIFPYTVIYIKQSYNKTICILYIFIHIIYLYILRMRRAALIFWQFSWPCVPVTSHEHVTCCHDAPW